MNSLLCTDSCYKVNFRKLSGIREVKYKLMSKYHCNCIVSDVNKVSSHLSNMSTCDTVDV